MEEQSVENNRIVAKSTKDGGLRKDGQTDRQMERAGVRYYNYIIYLIL